MHSHRATLTQKNKSFKSKHASKGSLKAKDKGKVNRLETFKKSTNHQSKADRRNANKIVQEKKRKQLQESNRQFGNIPKIVAVIPCTNDVNAEETVERLANVYGGQLMDGVLDMEKFRSKLRFIPCKRNMLEILDAAKVADICLLLLSATVEVDAFGQQCLSSLMAQGAPAVTAMALHLNSLPQKRQSGIRHSLSLFVKDRFPEEDKIFSLDHDSECQTMLRHLTTQRLHTPAWRERYPYMLIDKAEMQGSDLVIRGNLRGQTLSPNSLIYISNCGDYQISKIDVFPGGKDEPFDLNPQQELQESLVSENDPDPLMGEQTWPTAEELAEAEERVERKKKRVPKGTSSYQAAWISESEGESDDFLEVDQGSDEEMEQEEPEEIQQDVVPDEEWEEVEEDDKDALFDNQLNDEEEEEAYNEYLEKQRLARQDLEFPDEVDTPKHVAARVRFQKYRGLKSFRASPWDPYENLPVDYARIFQFENFRRTRERVMAGIDDVEGVMGGVQVMIHVSNFDKWEEFSQSFVKYAFGLLPHEHKMSVLNMTMTRTTEYQEPVKSKDEMVVQIGFRRFSMQPIYSSNTRGGNNVHKFERFFQPGSTCIATCFAPIHYAPCPVLMFLPSHLVNDNPTGPILVATGSVMDVDPTRILAKRIILTGHPFKINKRSVVVRYMFFNSQDVHWFKPIQLLTKFGKTGHIRESLGTHGYMKCVFDGKVNAQDTVCLYLYKRVFPKWTTNTYSLNSQDWTPVECDDMEIEK